MKKINRLILTFSILSISANGAEKVKEKELFNKVFGDKVEMKRVSLPTYFQDKFLGEIETNVVGNEIVSFSSNPFIQTLRRIISEKEIQRIIALKKETIAIEDLKFNLKFNLKELRLELEASDELIKPTESLFQESLIPYFSEGARRPSIFSGALNWKLEETITHNDLVPSFLNGNFDSFFNYKTFVLENQMQYSSERNYRRWYRSNTYLIKDDEKNAVRYILGDASSNTFGYLTSQNFLGLSVSRDYSITPYKINTPSSSQQFSVESRSIVRYYVNNSLLKTEFLNAGKYSVKDIPLNNGINKIIVEVEDEFGNKKYFNFRETFSNDLLREGDSKFDFSFGKTSTDIDYKKLYDSSKSYLSSGFYKRGWTDRFTNGIYFQNKSNFLLLGTENLFSTKLGNLGFGLGHSKHGKESGLAYNLNYYFSLFANSISNTQSLNFRIEKRDQKFNEGIEFSPSRYQYNVSSTYSLPFFDWASLGLGANVSKPYDHTLDNKYGIDASITGRLFKSSSLTFYLSNIRDEYKTWSQFFYLFLNFTFDDGYSYASAYYDSSAQSKRLSYYYDKGQAVNDVKVMSSIEANRYTKSADLDLSYNTKYVELGLRESGYERTKNHYYGRSSFRALSAFSFAYDKENFKLGLSRPITNSFAIIAPNEILKGQKLGLKSSGNRIIEESGLLNEIVVRDMIPYQYRRLQIDPSQLKEGYSLKKESFIVYPTYRSGHLIQAEANGTIAITGFLMDEKRRPVSLQVGEIQTNQELRVPFFTNKNGRFFIEGLNPGSMKFLLGDEAQTQCDVTIEGEASGVINLGEVKCLGKK